VAKSVLSEPQFQNEAAAFAYVEARLWPEGPTCPHCGSVDRIVRLNGKTTRMGLHKCNACKGQFTVRQGSIFESSHLPLHLWLQVIHLMCASKKGISTRQIQRMLQCSMKTAWFLGHRIREAMKSDTSGLIGGGGITVEADEAYLGKSFKSRRVKGEKPPMVFSLVERGGNVRSMYLDHRNVRAAMWANLDRDSRLVTDGHVFYQKFMPAGQHESVDHSKGEYVRGDVHTNTVEGFFSVFKRGLVGVYQHMDRAHLDRYLAEFDFRQNNREKLGISDTMRTSIAVTGAKGKRLTYETAGQSRA
jgi:transposase-like protein